MTKKYKKSASKKKNRAAGVETVEKNIRVWSIKRKIFVGLQAICGAVLGVCFFVYHYSAQIRMDDGTSFYETVPTFYEISRPYYESEIYSKNLEDAVSGLLRFVAIREQMETNGIFDDNKRINIGEYANRFNLIDYEGIDVEYYLGDLIKWGQKSQRDNVSYVSYKFYTLDEYCDFFNLDPDMVDAPETLGTNDTYVSFETIYNLYNTCDGLHLEDYVDNVNDYILLVSSLQKTVNDIYSNYLEYLDYLKKYSEDATNLRYAVTMHSGLKTVIYTNVSKINPASTEAKIEEVFKNYSQNIFCSPGSLKFINNTPLEYETIRREVIDNYAYSYPDDTKIWISIDTRYRVDDVFASNKLAFEKTAKVFPWIVSLAIISIVAFLTWTVYVIQGEKSVYSDAASQEYLRDFDRLPIEVGFLFFVLFIAVLMLGESLILRRMDYSGGDTLSGFITSSCILVLLDLYVLLTFFYGFTRRIICKNLFEGSIYSYIKPKLVKVTGHTKRWVVGGHDSSRVAVRTWTSYILFLLFNVFWACMLFFGRYPIASFLIILITDTIVGSILFNQNLERDSIIEGIKKITDGDYSYKIPSEKMHGDNKDLAEAVNNIGQGLERAVEVSTKDEKLKADLITNVSHDIKTPLTSIINYVDLLKRENIKDERIEKYIDILDEKSQRLKQLTFDLVEASKITSGNISIDLIKIDFNEFVKQAVGEFEDKLNLRGLSMVLNVPTEPTFILADPRHLWRVVENLLNNVCKYAMEDTRVYLDVVKLIEDKSVVISLKNISSQPLNIPAEELTERFIRGDVSRSTEGSGLGLSIAKSLTTAQKGEFEIYLDGDLFKTTLTFELQE